MSIWYLARDQRRHGPFTRVQIDQMVAAGQIAPSDLLCEQGKTQWTPASSVEGLVFPPILDEVPSAPIAFWVMNSQAVDGPYSVDQVQARLASGQFTPQTMICAAGSKEWQEAGALALQTSPGGLQAAHSAATVTNIETPEGAFLRWLLSLTWTHLDLALKVGAILAVPMWLLNDSIGKLFLVLAGVAWLAYGARVFLTGTAVSFAGSRHEANRRVAGVIAIVGLITATYGFYTMAQGSRGRAQFDQGISFMQQGEYDKAIESFSSVLQVSRHPLAFYNRGFAYQRKGDIERALADYTEAIRDDPTLKEAYLRRAGIYAKKGQLDLVIADYGSVIRLDPQNALAYFLRGVAHRDKGNNAQAEADIEAALKLDPRIMNLIQQPVNP